MAVTRAISTERSGHESNEPLQPTHRHIHFLLLLNMLESIATYYFSQIPRLGEEVDCISFLKKYQLGRVVSDKVTCQRDRNNSNIQISPMNHLF